MKALFPMISRKFLNRSPTALAALLLLSNMAYAQNPGDLHINILQTSMDDLLNMNVTSVSKSPEKLRTTAAAVTIITAEDIKRSGVTSLPAALRLAPGVEVAKLDANKWAVSIRGFNARAANKILVMIDGRTLYDPLFSGTLWETKDLMLENIERIEVIRGPGGSTWGANAVNGVISIITKTAQETQGGFVSGGGGSEERAFGNLRYGGKFSDTDFYQLWGQYRNRDEGYLPEGSRDDSWNGSGGFRLDGEFSADSKYSLIGEAHNNDSDGTTSFGDVDGKGESLTGKWEKTFSENSVLTAQAFYDYNFISTSIFDQRRHVAEMDLTHNYTFNNHWGITYGATYRYTSDEIEGTDFVTLDPDHRTLNQPSMFAKAKWNIIPDVLHAEFGAKVEHNYFTGTEIQPDASLLWQIDQSQVAWTRISRAVRTPSRIEADFLFRFPADGPVLFRGNPDLDTETLIAYELGYRVSLNSDLALDLAAYYNDYEQLVTFEGPTQGNGAQGAIYGGEASVTWTPLSWWKVVGTYTFVYMNLDLDGNSIADPQVAINTTEGNNPRNQAGLRSSIDFSERWKFDIDFRYVDSLSSPHVNSYIVADARLAWQMNDAIELAVVGQNLFERRHFEHAPPDSSQVEQGVYGKIIWTF